MAKRSKKPTEIVNRSVSFNLLDPDQKADYDYARDRGNFSAFCRLLIRLERLRQTGMVVAGPIHAPAKQEAPADNEVDPTGFV